MKAIILAAGIGSRMSPLTDNTPKSLLKIGEKTIIERMIDNIKSVGISEIIIITGYLEDQIIALVKKCYPHLKIRFIKNDKYLQANTGYSLMLTKNAVGHDDFIKFDADVVFETAVLKKLLKSKTSALCIDRNIHLEAEEVKVITDNSTRVIEVGKKIDPKFAKGESIGIEKIDQNAAKVLFLELETLMKDKANWQEYYDDSYTTLVKKGIPMHAIDITGLKWVEIDTIQDFDGAQKLFTD